MLVHEHILKLDPVDVLFSMYVTASFGVASADHMMSGAAEVLHESPSADHHNTNIRLEKTLCFLFTCYTLPDIASLPKVRPIPTACIDVAEARPPACCRRG